MAERDLLFLLWCEGPSQAPDWEAGRAHLRGLSLEWAASVASTEEGELLSLDDLVYLLKEHSEEAAGRFEYHQQRWLAALEEVRQWWEGDSPKALPQGLERQTVRGVPLLIGSHYPQWEGWAHTLRVAFLSGALAAAGVSLRDFGYLDALRRYSSLTHL